MGRDMGDTTLACSKKPACVGHEDERMSNYRRFVPCSNEQPGGGIGSGPKRQGASFAI